MISYIAIIIAALLLGVNFTIQNKFQQKVGGEQKDVLIYNQIVTAFAAVIFFGCNGFRLHITPYSVLMALAMSSMKILYIVIGFRIMKLEGITLYSLFLMTGAMVVPYLWGIAFLDEQFTFLRAIGLVLIVISMTISGASGKKADLHLLALCIAVFLLNGFACVINKQHQIETRFLAVDTGDFLVLINVLSFVLTSAALLANPKKNKNAKPPEKGYGDYLKAAIFLLIGAAVVDGSALFLQLFAAITLPATVLYPFVTGASVLFSSALDYFVFKKKPTPKIWLSLGICMIGTLLFL